MAEDKLQKMRIIQFKKHPLKYNYVLCINICNQTYIPAYMYFR